MISNQFTPTSQPISSTVHTQRTTPPQKTDTDAVTRQSTTDIPQQKADVHLSSKNGEYFPAIPDEESIAAMADAGALPSQNKQEQYGPAGAYHTVESTSNRERVGSLIDVFI